MFKNQKGFTLIELIVIIVIIGVLAAVAIPSYVNLTQDAANGTARGVLGALRGANALLFASRIIGNTPGSITMGDIMGSVQVQGVVLGATTFTDVVTFTVGGYSYTFSLTTGAVPTAMGTIYAATTTW